MSSYYQQQQQPYNPQQPPPPPPPPDGIYYNNNNGGQQQQQVFDFLKDAPEEMTRARRLALWLMHRYKWYNPRLGSVDEQPPPNEAPPPVDETTKKGGTRSIHAAAADAYPFSRSRREHPNLAKAWAYFEHDTLPRFIVKPKPPGHETATNLCSRILHRFRKGNQQLDKAEPGERGLPTKLYQPIWTPHKQLGDFGLGIGLYFSTLRALCILSVLAGLINLPNMMYFAGADYSNFQESVHTARRGSAVCTDTEWVPCINCNTSNVLDETRRRHLMDPITNQSLLTLALKNHCNGATLNQGMVNYATLGLIVVGIIALNLYLKQMEVAFDEDEQTAQDYSMVINNPPSDAADPQEWKDWFFQNFDGAHATALTVAVNNDLLVRSLVKRREILRQIEMKVEPGTSLDTLTLAKVAAKEENERTWFGRFMAMLSPGIPELFSALVVATAKVQGLAQQEYPVTNIFVTFETEAAQRRVLTALSVSKMTVLRQQIHALPGGDRHAFRGQHVLSVTEPEEPNTIRWEDLNVTFKEQAKQQALTLVCTFVAIVTIAVIVAVANERSTTWSALCIAVFNSIFPMFGKLLNNLEAHASEGSKQRSLYCKIAIFRWVNTAIVMTMITPFTATIANDDGIIEKIYALFFAEIVTTTVIQLTDPMGHVQRHFLAPRAKTQDSMNLSMKGSGFELAERYTNMTKIFFLAVWYCAIYPAAFWMCGFALLINYFVDRYSLMRTWARQPNLGTSTSQVSRRYFFSLCICAMALLSSFYWSAFPFDNLCHISNQTPEMMQPFVGSWHFWPPENKSAGPLTVVIRSDANLTLYQSCNQDYFRYRGTDSFPFIPDFQPPGKEWMTPEQEQLTTIYGWSALAVLLFVLLSFVLSAFTSIIDLFRSTYDPCGEDQGINFSDVPSISSYVPEVKSPIFSYPLLACSVDDIDLELLEWTDPDRPHSFYDLTKDARVLLRGIMDMESTKFVFSQIYYWAPPSRKQLPNEF